MNFREIKINSASNGIKVKVGCMELVYAQNDSKQFFADLKNYMKDPDKTEEEIRKRWGIKGEPNRSTHTLTIPPRNSETYAVGYVGVESE